MKALSASAILTYLSVVGHEIWQMITKIVQHAKHRKHHPILPCAYKKRGITQKSTRNNCRVRIFPRLIMEKKRNIKSEIKFLKSKKLKLKKN